MERKFIQKCLLSRMYQTVKNIIQHTRPLNRIRMVKSMLSNSLNELHPLEL